MKYVLEIYQPGTCYDDGVAAKFESDAPFLAIQPGDLLNKRTWGENAMEGAKEPTFHTLLRVIRTEHLIWKAYHMVMVFTEAADDTPDTRTRRN